MQDLVLGRGREGPAAFGRGREDHIVDLPGGELPGILVAEQGDEVVPSLPLVVGKVAVGDRLALGADPRHPRPGGEEESLEEGPQRERRRRRREEPRAVALRPGEGPGRLLLGALVPDSGLLEVADEVATGAVPFGSDLFGCSAHG